MYQKQNHNFNKQIRQCLTLTADVTDIIKALKSNQNWKTQTNKLNKTIVNKNQLEKTNNITKNKPTMTEQDLQRMFNSKQKMKTEVAQLNYQPYNHHHQWNQHGYRNLVKKITFLNLDDKWDKLLTGLQTQQDSDEDQNQTHNILHNKNDLTATFKRDYLIGKIVGEGAYATVRVAIYKPLNIKIAIKVYEKSKINEIQRKRSVRRQIIILQLLNHRNIVKIYDVVQTNNHLNIIMEYLSGISLNCYLKNQMNNKISQANSRKIIKPLVEALKYLHQRNISHRDIKLQNIILNQELSPKLIDFGFSTCIETTKKVKIFCGTPSYMAPEIVQKKQYHGEPADIWALGVLFFVTLTGFFPFKGSTDQQLYKKIINAQYPRIQSFNQDLADLIDKMLKIEPFQRITAKQILNHPWMKNRPSILLNAKTNLDESLQNNKKKTLSSQKLNEDTLPYNKKFNQTCKNELRLELKLVCQSPSRSKINTCTNRRFEREISKITMFDKREKTENIQKIEKIEKRQKVINMDKIQKIAKNFHIQRINKSNKNVKNENELVYQKIDTSGKKDKNKSLNYLMNKINKNNKIKLSNNMKTDNSYYIGTNRQLFSKTNSKVLDLLRNQMKKRQQEKSKDKTRRF